MIIDLLFFLSGGIPLPPLYPSKARSFDLLLCLPGIRYSCSDACAIVLLYYCENITLLYDDVLFFAKLYFVS